MLKTLVNFAILTTVVIAVWIFVSIFHSFTSTTISDSVAVQIKPISPTFDTGAILILQKKTFIPTDLSENILEGNSASASAIQQVEVDLSPTPVASASGVINTLNF